MAGVITNEGHLLALEAVIRSGLVVHLYVNPCTPRRADQCSTYHELAVLGYGPISLDPSLTRWQIADGPPLRAVYREAIIWRFDGVGPIVQGYFLTVGRRLYGVEPFPKAIEIINHGDAISIVPVLTGGPQEH